ncbi:MAG TPA: hypothetical protein VKV40_21225 [Ktedonobacteraceae bacterium]|nr:hypothetical protein [Ktedonobacteraceae bacterium]
MTVSSSSEYASRSRRTEEMQVKHLLASGQLESVEQVRRFELLRLAFFALKLRKLEQRQNPGEEHEDGCDKERGQTDELEFHRSLLRHVIFQQVLTLMKLDARKQALQIIAACRQ